MTDVRFDRLADVALRDAWKHEALTFTPWLAENIDHIAEAVGRPLELTVTEVPVGSFSADIRARDLQDDSVVLIENQLEPTDHTHLGQIMTYLAGLDAKSVIWIAPFFREPHLSAIRWLNQHTADGFSFFALKLRVVRIGESPYAPIFEVLEKPRDWDRSLQQKVREVDNEDRDHREAFWSAYVDRHPTIVEAGLRRGRRDWVFRLGLIDGVLQLTIYLAARSCGVYVNGPWGGHSPAAEEWLAPRIAALAASLDTEPGGEGGRYLRKQIDCGYKDPARRSEVIDWLEAERRRYTETIAAMTEMPA